MAVIVASMVRLIITAVSYFAMLLQPYDSPAITCSKCIDAKQVFARAALAEHFALPQSQVPHLSPLESIALSRLTSCGDTDKGKALVTCCLPVLLREATAATWVVVAHAHHLAARRTTEGDVNMMGAARDLCASRYLLPFLAEAEAVFNIPHSTTSAVFMASFTSSSSGSRASTPSAVWNFTLIFG